MLTPFRLIVLLCVAAVTPYIASETEFGRSTVTRLTNLLRSDSNKRPTDGTLTSWNSGSAWQSDSSGYGGSQSYGGSASDSTYANHSHYEVEKLRRSAPDQYRYDEQLARKLGGIPQGQPSPSLVGARIPDLREVMRFDISPDWVIQRFSRVSTVLADLSLQGLRVPVVTGTQADDLAGTLTYYFDKGGKLQRLTVHGFTGSPENLVGTLTQHYGLKHEPALEAGVYTKRWNGQPTHFLRLTHAPVVYSDAVHQKYTMFLELNHPNLAYGISNEARRIVTADRATGRW